MKCIFKIIIIISLILVCDLSSEIFKDIDGEGIGISKKEALINAKRNALGRSVGMILSSRSLANNNILVKDRILTKSEGFIKKYEITNESVDNDIHQIKIKADITNLIDNILKDELAIKFLVEEMGFPKFGVMINNKEGSRDKFAENIIIDNFMRSYFNVHQLVEGENNTIETEVDFIIQGSVDYSTSAIKAYNIENMYSVHTKIECKIISMLDNKIISSDTFTTKKAHFDPEEAKRQSISLCSDKISKFLIQDSIEKWSRYYNEELKNIDIIIDNISYETSEELTKVLRYIFNGIESIVVKEYKDQSQHFMVNSLIDTDNIYHIIKDELLKFKKEVKINSVSDNKISLELF
ncbi:MAG: hypothetical protein KAH33_02340 [Candidatus Delongbacteria bacterium]|nr:hypothetical protein [Candidatus Delongbacteria bacterium]